MLQRRSAARHEAEGVSSCIGIGLAAAHQATLLQIRDRRDKIGFLNAERRRHSRLAGAGILVDHQQYGKLTGPQVKFSQRVVEICKYDPLRAAQCVAYVAAEWRHFHGPVCASPASLVPRWAERVANLTLCDIGALPTPS